MRQSIVAQQNMRDSIDRELATRIQVHQARIARLKTARAAMAVALAKPSATPLVLLAHGDSWFDYPLSGNDLSLGDTDVIAQLRSMGQINPVILNVSHHGDASTDELSWPKQQRMIDVLADPANWIGHGPDAILFSGGGDDVAGDHFCIYLDYKAPGATGLNTPRFQGMLSSVTASYLDLFAFRDRYATNVPIFAHCYDFPIPNGAHPDCVGPWLKPSLDYSGWTDLADGTQILHDALSQFKARLTELAIPANNFTMVDTQGAMIPADWANELHPYPDGFKKIAARFVLALRARFPGRI